MSYENIDIDKLVKEIFKDKKIVVHKLKSKYGKLVPIILLKDDDESYCFYKAQIDEYDNKLPKVSLLPISNIFEYIEENEIDMELSKDDGEENNWYDRCR